MKARRQLLRLAAACALVVATAACSSSNKGGTSKVTSTTKPSTFVTVDGSHVGDPCAFLTTADLTQLFGRAPTSTKGNAIINGKTCTVSANTNDLIVGLVVSIQEGTATYGETYLQGTHVDHLGERAFIQKHSIGNAMIIGFIHGGRTYTISYTRSKAGDPTVQPANQADQLLAMIRTAAAKLS